MNKENNYGNGATTGVSFFLTGMLVGVGSMYLFGTKKGREVLKKMNDTFENLEFSMEDILSEIEDTAEKYIDENLSDKNRHSRLSDTLDGVIGKIKNVLPEKKDVRSYVVRDGKITNSA